MKKIIALFFAACFVISAQSQNSTQKSEPIVITDQVIEASCGECNFHLDGNGCSLAVRIDGKAYFVKGADINDYGNAHAKDGFCNAIRKAKVSGKVVKNKFVAKKFELLPAQNQ